MFTSKKAVELLRKKRTKSRFSDVESDSRRNTSTEGKTSKAIHHQGSSGLPGYAAGYSVGNTSVGNVGGGQGSMSQGRGSFSGVLHDWGGSNKDSRGEKGGAKGSERSPYGNTQGSGNSYNQGRNSGSGGGSGSKAGGGGRSGGNSYTDSKRERSYDQDGTTSFNSKRDDGGTHGYGNYQGGGNSSQMDLQSAPGSFYSNSQRSDGASYMDPQGEGTTSYMDQLRRKKVSDMNSQGSDNISHVGSQRRATRFDDPSEKPNTSFMDSNSGSNATYVNQQKGFNSPYVDQQRDNNPYMAQQRAVNPYLDQQRDVSPYLDQQRNVNPYLDQKRDVNPYLDQKKDVNPYLDQPRDVNPYLDQPKDVNPYLDQQRDVNPYLDKRSDVNPYVDKQRDVNPYLDQQRGVNPYLDQKRDVNPYLDQPKDVNPYLDKRSDVNPYLDQPRDVNPYLDQPRDVNPYLDQQRDVNPYLDKRSDDNKYLDKRRDENSYLDQWKDDRSCMDKRNDDKPYVDQRKDDRSYMDKRRDDNPYMDQQRGSREPNLNQQRESDPFMDQQRGSKTSYADQQNLDDPYENQQRGSRDPYKDQPRRSRDSYMDRQRSRNASPMDQPRRNRDSYMDRQRSRNASPVDQKRGNRDSYVDRQRSRDSSPVDQPRRNRDSYVDRQRSRNASPVDQKRGTSSFFKKLRIDDVPFSELERSRDSFESHEYAKEPVSANALSTKDAQIAIGILQKVLALQKTPSVNTRPRRHDEFKAGGSRRSGGATPNQSIPPRETRGMSPYGRPSPGFGAMPGKADPYLDMNSVNIADVRDVFKRPAHNRAKHPQPSVPRLQPFPGKREREFGGPEIVVTKKMRKSILARLGPKKKDEAEDMPKQSANVTRQKPKSKKRRRAKPKVDPVISRLEQSPKSNVVSVKSRLGQKSNVNPVSVKSRLGPINKLEPTNKPGPINKPKPTNKPGPTNKPVIKLKPRDVTYGLKGVDFYPHRVYTPIQIDKLVAKNKSCPVAALHCKICEEMSFESVRDYIIHLQSANHVLLRDTLKEKIAATMQLMQKDIRIALYMKYDFPFKQAKKDMTCVFCDVPKYWEGDVSEDHLDLVECRTLHQYFRPIPCCKNEYHLNRIAFEFHRMSVEHLEYEHSRRLARDKDDKSYVHKLERLQEKYLDGNQENYPSLNSLNHMFYSNSGYVCAAIMYQRFGTEPIPQEILDLIGIYEKVFVKRGYSYWNSGLARKARSHWGYYEPSAPTGVNQIVILPSVSCDVCDCSMGTSKESILSHCSSRSHYDKVVEQRQLRKQEEEGGTGRSIKGEKETKSGVAAQVTSKESAKECGVNPGIKEEEEDGSPNASDAKLEIKVEEGFAYDDPCDNFCLTADDMIDAEGSEDQVKEDEEEDGEQDVGSEDDNEFVKAFYDDGDDSDVQGVKDKFDELLGE